MDTVTAEREQINFNAVTSGGTDSKGELRAGEAERQKQSEVGGGVGAH